MSTYASPVPSGKSSPKGFLRVLGKIFTGSGVIESTALTVSVQTTPDMTVQVSGSALNDNAIFIYTDGTFIQAWNESAVSVTITANTSGVIKTDAIVAYVDLAAGLGGVSDPANNPGALKFVAVRRSGISTGAPTSAEIATAVSNNPSIVLAYVTVASGLGSSPGDAINSGNITDQRVRAVLSTNTVPTAAIQDAAVTTGKIDFSTFESGTSNGYSYDRMGKRWIATKSATITAAGGQGVVDVAYPTGITGSDVINKQVSIVGVPASWDWSTVFNGAGTLTVYVWNKASNSGTVTINVMLLLSKKPT